LRAAGRFFQSPYPDYYASFVTMLKAERILLDPEPRTIIGISPKSFGFFSRKTRSRPATTCWDSTDRTRTSCETLFRAPPRRLIYPDPPTLSWTFAAMKRARSVLPRHIHQLLFELFRIYSPVGRIHHDIGQHVSIWDAWAWLDRRYEAATAAAETEPAGAERPVSTGDEKTQLESASCGSNDPGESPSTIEKSTAPSTEAAPQDPFASLGLLQRFQARRDLRQQARLVVASGAFDVGWYLARYHDVRKAGIDPVLHYLSVGCDAGI
jgi:hypothetical protein